GRRRAGRLPRRVPAPAERPARNCRPAGKIRRKTSASLRGLVKGFLEEICRRTSDVTGKFGGPAELWGLHEDWGNAFGQPLQALGGGAPGGLLCCCLNSQAAFKSGRTARSFGRPAASFVAINCGRAKTFTGTPSRTTSSTSGRIWSYPPILLISPSKSS